MSQLEMLHLLLPSLGEAVECSGDAEEEVWEAWEEWEEWEDQAWEELGWEEWEWEPDAAEWEEGEDSGSGSGLEEQQAPGLDQPLRR